MKPRRRGTAAIEFTLTGLPMMALLLSSFEMARAMWHYHTLAHAVKEAGRFASVRGRGCAAPNSCSITVGDVVGRLQSEGLGLDPASLAVTLTSAGGDVACSPSTSCNGNATVWPPTAGNGQGQDIRIFARYTFGSALVLLWPGQAGRNIGQIALTAYSRQRIQF